MPTPARTVQLRHAADVIAAYENWDNPHFAIWNGKQLLFTYDKEDATVEEGAQMLDQFLNWILGGGSAGIYTLAIYRDNHKSITNNTPYNGSINFQLNDYNYASHGASGGAVNGIADPGMKLVLDELKAMKMDISKLKDSQTDEGDEDDEGDALGQITKFLDNPIVAGILGSLLPNFKQQPKQVTQPLHIPSNEPGTATKISGSQDPKQDQQRMAEALKELQATVPNLPEVLERLSKMATVKPLQFKLYLSALMNMKL